MTDSYASTGRNERTTLYHQRNFVFDSVTVLLMVKLILKISVMVDLATRVVSGGPTSHSQLVKYSSLLSGPKLQRMALTGKLAIICNIQRQLRLSK